MNNALTTITTDINDTGILTITLNRPNKLNALSNTMFEELAQVFDEAEQNDIIKGLLITGNGKAFCAGADINRLAEANAAAGYEFAKQGQGVFNQLENCPKPSIAAINGFAIGGGCELTMAASIRIASEQAKFSQPEVKLGVIPGYGATQRLARLVGKGRAIDMCITARMIDAQHALNWGLVTEVLPHEQLIQRATELLQHILSMGPLAVSKAMAVINQGFDMALHEAFELEALRFGMLCDTADKQEGTAAFLEKRQAQFRGE